MRGLTREIKGMYKLRNMYKGLMEKDNGGKIGCGRGGEQGRGE